MTEITPPGTKKHVVNATISINVLPVQDTPMPYISQSLDLLTESLFRMEEAGEGIHHTKGDTNLVTLDKLVAADVDEGDSIGLVLQEPHRDIAVTVVREIAVPTEIREVVPKARVLMVYEVSMEFPHTYTGKLLLTVLVNDSIRYSAPVVYNVQVMLNPCLHGECGPRDPVSHICDDVIRTESFEPFQCVCQPGYEGDLCDEDLNECFGNPCDLLYDCQETVIAAYICVIGVPKILAITTCLMVALGSILLFNILVLRKRERILENEVNPTEDW